MGHITERLQWLVENQADGKPTVFAKKAGIPHSTFLNYLKGRMPHTEHLVRIHDTFSINLNWLLTGKGGPYAPEIESQLESEVPTEVAQLLKMTREIITSDTEYAFSLMANIRSFHNSVLMQRRLEDHERRIAQMEQEKCGKEKRIRDGDPMEQKEEIIKKRATS